MVRSGHLTGTALSTQLEEESLEFVDVGSAVRVGQRCSDQLEADSIESALGRSQLCRDISALIACVIIR